MTAEHRGAVRALPLDVADVMTRCARDASPAALTGLVAELCGLLAVPPPDEVRVGRQEVEVTHRDVNGGDGADTVGCFRLQRSEVGEYRRTLVVAADGSRWDIGSTLLHELAHHLDSVDDPDAFIVEGDHHGDGFRDACIRLVDCLDRSGDLRPPTLGTLDRWPAGSRR